MSDLTLVRATVQMVGVDLGEHVLVDTDDSEIKTYLDKGYLVPIATEPPATTDDTEDEPLVADLRSAFAAPIDLSETPSV